MVLGCWWPHNVSSAVFVSLQFKGQWAAVPPFLQSYELILCRQLGFEPHDDQHQHPGEHGDPGAVHEHIVPTLFAMQLLDMRVEDG